MRFSVVGWLAAEKVLSDAEMSSFVEVEDEEFWIRIQNEAYREHDDFRPDTRKTNS